jgi:protein-disulfide isomerase/uncharacterized membrane protein
MEKASKRFLDLAILATIIAIGLHVYLTRQHYGLKFGSATSASVCTVSSVFSCDAVAASTYSTFLGMPLALWGAVANAVLLFLLLITRQGWTDEPAATGRYSLWLATLIALASVGMASLSFTQMTTYCLFCIACYALSFVSLIGTWKGVGGFGSIAADFRALFTTRRWLLFVALAIPVGAFLINASAESGAGFKNVELIANERIADWKSTPQKNLDPTRGLVLEASGVAPIMTIVEFADFRCPHCKHAYPTLHAFAQAHSDVQLVFKSFPLDGTCNPSLAGQGGDGISCRMAFIVQCEEKLRQQGWQAHHYFFDHQEAMMSTSTIAQLDERYCADRGGDCAALKACADSTATLDEVRALAQEGIDAQIRGTPSVFVNGRLLNGGQLLPILEAARASLKK